MAKNGISGIMHIEGYGTITLFASEAGKILVLAESKLQHKLQKAEENIIIANELEGSRKHYNSKQNLTRNYIG